MANSLFVLDAFALIGFFKSEPFAEAVEALFRRAERNEVSLVASVVNVGELYYKTSREFGLARADTVLAFFDEYAIDLIAVDRDLALDAALIKGVYPISYADCIAAALTQRLGATLVTGDPDFRLIPDLAIEWLSA